MRFHKSRHSESGATWVEFAIVIVILMSALIGVSYMLGTLSVRAQSQTVDAQTYGVACTPRTKALLQSSSLGINAQQGCK